MHRRHDLPGFLASRRLFGPGMIISDDPRFRASHTFWGERSRRRGRVIVTSDPNDPLLPSSAPGLLDFLYLDQYPSSLTADLSMALLCLCRRVGPGGFVGGGKYFSGTVEGCGIGAKEAVDAVASELGLQVAVTLDLIPSWWAVVPASPGERESRPSQKVLVLSGHDGDSAQAEMAALSTPNKQAYCDRHGYDLDVRTTGFIRSRHPVWSRLRFLAEALHRYDWAWWTDVDSLVLEPHLRLERFLDDDCDMVITCDDLGTGTYHVNAGQFFLRNSPWSAAFLKEWWGQTRFLHDPMQEQRALIHLLESRDLSRHVRIVTQRRFNAFPSNYRSGDFLIHFAGLRNDTRLPLMRSFAGRSTTIASFE